MNDLTARLNVRDKILDRLNSRSDYDSFNLPTRSTVVYLVVLLEQLFYKNKRSVMTLSKGRNCFGFDQTMETTTGHMMTAEITPIMTEDQGMIVLDAGGTSI